MKKKITLTIDEKLIEFVRTQAKKNRKSISAMVEQYFEELKKQIEDTELDPRIKELYGILENYNIPDKKELRKLFHGKSNN